MKKKNFIVLLLCFLLFVSADAQKGDSIFVRKMIDTTENVHQKQSTKAIVRFFDLESHQIFQPAGGININNVFILANKDGQVELYLSKDKYLVWARCVGFADTKRFQLDIDPKNAYIIEIYLTRSKESIALAN